MQLENRKLQEDVQNGKRSLELKDKDLFLAKKEASGLQEDNERLNRMYLLMQKEAFNSVDKLKAKENEFVDYGKNALIGVSVPAHEKKGY
jgi:hypothetical protein